MIKSKAFIACMTGFVLAASLAAGASAASARDRGGNGGNVVRDHRSAPPAAAPSGSKTIVRDHRGSGSASGARSTGNRVTIVRDHRNGKTCSVKRCPREDRTPRRCWSSGNNVIHCRPI